jgi:hypothetical protein
MKEAHIAVENSAAEGRVGEYVIYGDILNVRQLIS